MTIANMKNLGFIFIAVGLAIFLYVVVNLFLGEKKLISPLPENGGIKVIFTSPTK